MTEAERGEEEEDDDATVTGVGGSGGVDLIMMPKGGAEEC